MSDPKDKKTLNQKVVIWARGKTGQQVGKRGECWDLADQALRHSGAQSSTTTGKDDDYVWGDPVDLKDVQPGDILQFRDHDVTTVTETKTEFTDGEWRQKKDTKEQKRGHHTAIVDAVNGKKLTVLEQHVRPGGKKVQRHELPIETKDSKTEVKHVRVKDSSGKMREAKVTVTVTVTISGAIQAYRPKAQ
jgi:hypothetical protein